MLPKIDVPIYDLQLLSLKDKVRYRPFTVKEEKLFLMAGQSDEKDTILNTVKQVVNNCILDKINVNNLPIFDLEYIFLNLRAKSVGEEVNLKYQCNNILEDDKKCNSIVNFNINLTDVKPEYSKEHKTKIEITDKMGIVMKYPTVKSVENQDIQNEADSLFQIMVDCIDYVYDNDEIFYAKDTKREELVEFVDSLQTKDLQKIKVFFETMPKIKKETSFECKKCGYKDKLTIEGIESFFG